jgi:hypothetical protein
MRNLSHELRFSEQLPEGIRRIDPRQLRYIKRRLEAVRASYPQSAIVGGTALRIWCEIRNRDIPEETANPDIDIITPGLKRFQHSSSLQTGRVEEIPRPLAQPFEEPSFTQVDYEDDELTIITPPHMMVNYAALIIDYAARGITLSKQLTNYQISKSVVSPPELHDYTTVIPTYYGTPIAELMTEAEGHIPVESPGT